jgi:4-hydroxythreonine-4-phosphate dehydrogenase
MNRRILITAGDPAGVGPELALRALEPYRSSGIRIGLVGSAPLFHRVARSTGLSVPPTIAASDFESRGFPDSPHCTIDLPGLDAASVRPGVVDATTGAASLHWVQWSIDAILRGAADAVVTGPIHKEAWHAAGAQYLGHTELFADRAGSGRHCMMLAAPTIRCALVTVHIGLADVSRSITTAAILETIELAASAVSRIVGAPARIAVLGLNPHAGEGGLFGNQEEEKIIAPAISAAVRSGLNVIGPLPPDTAFLPAMREKIDVYVCMYHDQGLIPLKALAFDTAVNVTLGLGIVRTSVDHGTALDIAWQGVADPGSIHAAVAMAIDLCAVRSESGGGG